jgi:hypothetical protein
MKIVSENTINGICDGYDQEVCTLKGICDGYDQEVCTLKGICDGYDQEVYMHPKGNL